ncbi:MAG: hypothetical protein IRY99_26450, partial [Isosphaeraceae bacterium]|nr:hypothetical protein [Isosphaeraceae bacterium]
QLGAADLIAALAALALGPEGAEGPTLVQGRPSRPDLAETLAERSLARVLPRAPRTARLALAAGLLQMHDFWDASHAAAQEADDLGERAASAYWHGIAHRREPDAGNASYWFRRVGRHPVFEPLAEAARPLLHEHGDPALTGRLLRGGTWDPFAFIDFCMMARNGSPAETLARRLQRREMLLLLDHSAQVAGAV